MDSVAWYVLLLIPPLVLIAVPVYVQRNIPFMIAFAAITFSLILFGAAYHLTAVHAGATTPTALSAPVDMLKISAYFGFIGAGAIWSAFAQEVYRLTGVSAPKSTE